MELTKHARTRGKQRGINEVHMKLLVAFGRPTRLKHNVIEYRLDKNGIEDIEQLLKCGVQILDKLKHQVIISDELSVITCYHA